MSRQLLLLLRSNAYLRNPYCQTYKYRQINIHKKTQTNIYIEKTQTDRLRYKTWTNKYRQIDRQINTDKYRQITALKNI